MERLWAPWRIEFLTRPKDDICIFCREGDRRELLILKESPLVRIMLNRYPYCNGHLMISPRRHVADPGALSDEESLALMKSLALCREILISASSPDGFNIGMNLGRPAGAGIEDHLHIHVVPRWNGDNNFMTVVGDLRVIPEALLTTYDRLFPLFNAEEGS